MYADRLQLAVRHLRPTPSRPQFPRSHIPSGLSTCDFVFVRHDAVKKPLQPPYDGPFKVLVGHDKYFVLDIASKQNTISLDRLKAAHLDSDTAPPFPLPITHFPPPFCLNLDLSVSHVPLVLVEKSTFPIIMVANEEMPFIHCFAPLTF